MINGTNNPFPCDPVIYSASNTIIAVGTITRNNNIFTFSPGFKWRINGVVYENTTPINITVAVASSGKYRIDNALLNTSNSIELQQGLESDTIAIRPAYPENTILLTSWNVFGEIIDNNIDPIEGSDFIKKTFAYYFNANVSGVEASIPFDVAGRTEIRLTNPALQSIATVNVLDLSGIDTAERPYSGKPYIIRNLTGNTVVVKDSVDIAIIGNQRPRYFPFLLKEDQDLQLPNNEAILFHFVDNAMVEIFRSWSEIDLSQKADLVGGKVPASQLPSYVDDVLEFANFAALPVVGESSKIYVTLDTNKQYRWGGTAYVEISASTAVWGSISGDINSQADLIDLINTRKSPCLKMGSGAILSNFKNLFSTQSGSRLTNSLDLSPFVPEYNFTSSNLVFNITSGAAGANCRLVIYSHDPVTGLPKDRIFESADQSVSGTGVRLVPCVYDFEVGKAYWLGLVCSSATPTFTSVPAASQNFIGINVLGGSFSGYTFLQKAITSYNNTPLVYGTTHNKALSIFPIIGIQIQ